MKMPKSITVMKYLGTDGEHHFEIVDDLQYPSLEDRMNYLARLERRLWADGEIVEHLWTRTSENCGGFLVRLLDYECQTTFWQDFTIADRFGLEAVKDTYERAKQEWGDDRIYGTELSMVLNHKCWYYYERNNTLSKLYSDLWTKYHDYVLDNWKGEKLKYYLETTD